MFQLFISKNFEYTFSLSFSIHNSLFTFFTEQGKIGKNGTHGHENLATYFWYLGSFDEKRTYENK